MDQNTIEQYTAIITNHINTNNMYTANIHSVNSVITTNTITTVNTQQQSVISWQWLTCEKRKFVEQSDLLKKRKLRHGDIGNEDDYDDDGDSDDAMM